jgi:hypothetical protein
MGQEPHTKSADPPSRAIILFIIIAAVASLREMTAP